MAANLHFRPGAQEEGFTPAGVQAFNDLNPDAIVRELIQNSLDAVREADRPEAIMRFELEEITLDDVPEINAYKTAFNSAVKSQKEMLGGELPDQAAMVVDAINGALEQRDNILALSVLDNGLGLDTQRMFGLLADGMSVKTSAGAGAVGNGHLTAIPASDLRYVLYGGVSDEGKIATGHAILASFADAKDQLMGKDGYYALSVRPSMKDPCSFVPEGDMAPLIKAKLDWIEVNFASKTGAAVIIPGFNGFREKQDLWALIKKAAACSFFTAIADGDLQIIYKDQTGEKCLNSSNIADVFANGLDEQKRAKHFLSGGRAAQANKTATAGKPFAVDVGCGKVEVRLRTIEDGRSRIDLCRNGMWITDYLPRLNKNQFTDRKPFHALIKVTAEDGEIHRLIRKSEGPLHNHIEAKKWLRPEEIKQLNDAFQKIAGFLLAKLEPCEDETFEVDDFLNIHMEDGNAAGGSRAGKVGQFEEMPQTRPRQSKSDGGDGGSGKGDGGDSLNTFKRSGNPIPFGAVPVPTGPRSWTVELYPQEQLNTDAEAEIRFVLDENIDATCDRYSEEQFVILTAVTLNGQTVADDQLIRGSAGIMGVRLGQFRPPDKHRLEFDYQLPEGLNMQLEARTFLRAEIVRRRKQTRENP